MSMLIHSFDILPSANKGVVDEFPNLREILQRYTNEHVLEIEIPERIFEDHGISMK